MIMTTLSHPYIAYLIIISYTGDPRGSSHIFFLQQFYITFLCSSWFEPWLNLVD
jgi:hypothetical protein